MHTHKHIYQGNLNVIKNVSQFFCILYSVDLLEKKKNVQSKKEKILNWAFQEVNDIFLLRIAAIKNIIHVIIQFTRLESWN